MVGVTEVKGVGGQGSIQRGVAAKAVNEIVAVVAVGNRAVAVGRGEVFMSLLNLNYDKDIFDIKLENIKEKRG